MAKTWYEVRVRECISPPKHVDGRWTSGQYTKKSKFYFTDGPKEAAGKYKGNGHIMYAEKVSRERLLGIGEFFRLGDELLKEFKKGGTLLEQIEGSKDKRRQRINYKQNIRRGSNE